MLLENSLKFNENISYAEDECFNLCTYPFAKTIVYVPKIFYSYRVRESGATFSSLKNKFNNYINIWKYILKKWKEYGISNSKYFELFTYHLTYKGRIYSIFEKLCLDDNLQLKRINVVFFIK